MIGYKGLIHISYKIFFRDNHANDEFKGEKVALEYNHNGHLRKEKFCSLMLFFISEVLNTVQINEIQTQL
jgi:hypothetical protein